LDKLTEELVEVERLKQSGESFLVALADAHRAYEETLIKENRVDFAHLEKFFLDVLDNEEVGGAVRESVRYVMVDEYQDTNYIQERLLERLSEATGSQVSSPPFLKPTSRQACIPPSSTCSGSISM
jgi:DNA helicase II / ATP-dependent DNA helicase PcrA